MPKSTLSSYVAIAFLLLLLFISQTLAFAPVRQPTISVIELAAKKSKRKTSAGQGFGRKEEESMEDSAVATADRVTSKSFNSNAAEAESDSSLFLKSVQGGSSNVPAVEEKESTSIAPEDRAKMLLREKYGMKTLEEERLDQKQRQQLEAQRQKFAELKARADADDDFDLMELIPGEVLNGIYTLLKSLVAIVGTTFLLSGFAITLEAWSKSTGSPLPDDIDTFIANVVEPNFTTQLLVLLSCSVSWGGLAALQLGSKSAQYREE